MKRYIFWVLVSQFWVADMYAITCTENDYQPALCDLPILEGVRCANAEFFRSYCSEKTEGCAAVGGCFGFTPPGHWYPILGTDGRPFRRCRCGCFAKETQFWGLERVTGQSLLQGKDGRLRLYVMQELETSQLSRKSINGLMHAKENRAVHLVAAGGYSIFLSQGHPVVVASATGKLRAMKQAKDVKRGDFLLTQTHRPIQVVQSETVSYAGEMMNFNVESKNPMHHIVIANGMQMGDLAWQEKLHGVEARMYHRQDLLDYLKRMPK